MVRGTVVLCFLFKLVSLVSKAECHLRYLVAQPRLTPAFLWMFDVD